MNENRFQLSRKEFADKLGISTDNLKKKMKRGHYQSSYIKRDGKYYFAVQEAVRPNQMSPGRGTEAIILKANILI